MPELWAAAELVVKVWSSPDPLTTILALSHLEMLGLSALVAVAALLVNKLVTWLSRLFRR